VRKNLVMFSYHDYGQLWRLEAFTKLGTFWRIPLVRFEKIVEDWVFWYELALEFIRAI